MPSFQASALYSRNTEKLRSALFFRSAYLWGKHGSRGIFGNVLIL